MLTIAEVVYTVASRLDVPEVDAPSGCDLEGWPTVAADTVWHLKKIAPRALANRSNERRLLHRRRALPLEIDLRDQLHEAWRCSAHDPAEVGVFDLTVY